MLAVPATAVKLTASVVAVPELGDAADCIDCTTVVTCPNKPVPFGADSVKYPRCTNPVEGIVPVCKADTLSVVPSSKKLTFVEMS